MMILDAAVVNWNTAAAYSMFGLMFELLLW